MLDPEYRERSYGRLERILAVGTLAALLLSQDHNDMQEIREKRELVKNRQATAEAALHNAVRARQDIARQFGSCSINGFLYVYSGFKYGQVNYVEVDKNAQDIVRQRPAEVVPRDQIKLQVALTLQEASLIAWKTTTRPNISVHEAVPRANRVRMDEHGHYKYAEPVPIDVEYDRQGTQAVATVNVYPPTDKRGGAPIAIRMSTAAAFEVPSRIHEHLSIGTILCGFVANENGEWRPMSINDSDLPDMRPTTFEDVDRFN